MLEIQSNGSKWNGQEPDSINELIQVLNNYSLDPTFEDYGNFVNNNPEWLKKEATEKYQGCTKFFGNFSPISHVFNIITDDAEIIEALTEAINNNKSTEDYHGLRQEFISDKLKKEELNKLLYSGKIEYKEYNTMLASR